MGVVKKHPRPVGFPGHTVWGGVGECVYVGEIIQGDGAMNGIAVNLNERECREIVHAWGWPTKEQHQELIESAEKLAAQVETLETQLAEALSQQTRVVPFDEIEKIWDAAAKADVPRMETKAERVA